MRQVANVLAGFTTTDRPSIATWSSTYSMPFALQARPSPSSSALIGRDASLMSVSPTQNFLKPPPVPEKATGTWTPLLAFWNSSATAWVIGYTVLEPSIVTVPLNTGASDAGAAELAAADGAADAPVEGAAELPLPLVQAPMANDAVNASAPRRFAVVLNTSMVPPTVWCRVWEARSSSLELGRRGQLVAV